MKIKQICELTGLTDRAVRFYIEEGLASPAYTENYLGRRSFDFTEEDAAHLTSIATLRKFGFTVEEIRRMIADPQEIRGIIGDVQARKETSVRQEAENLAALARLEADRDYTVAELAQALNEPVREVAAPEERRHSWATWLESVVTSAAMLLVALLPVLAVAEGIRFGLQQYHYARFGMWEMICILIALVPTIVMVILWHRKRRGKGRFLTRWAAIVLCLVYMPVSVFAGVGGAVGHSVTTDIYDYRRFDPDCLFNRDSFLQDLLPLWPGSYKDAEYLYRNLPAFDYTYDVYAEWTLPAGHFDGEVQRVQALFAQRMPDHVTMTKGRWTLLMEPDGYEPFQPVTDSYDIYIFAYDPERCRVRYIVCSSLENGVDQPYYLELDW